MNPSHPTVEGRYKPICTPRQSAGNPLPAPAGGYTLIETVISLVLLTTALLGLGALYNLSLHSSHGAILHDFATLQAADMAERIRGNPSAVVHGHYLGLSGEPSGTDCTTAHCTPEEMARFDFREWNRQNSTLLPSGSGSITRTSPENYTATINWSDGDDSPSHSLIFRPPE